MSKSQVLRFAFYPRPLGGRRLPAGANGPPRMRFLSTPSGWGATTRGSQWPPAYAISIHALRVEGDAFRVKRNIVKVRFLSTPSGWRATAQSFRKSIALRLYFYPRPPGGGRLAPSTNKCVNKVYFYPRPPGGGRPDTSRAFLTRYHFYPRPPGGGRHRR